VTPPPVDLGSVHEQLAAIRNELTSLRESRITKTDMEGQTGILYRLVAEQLIAVHIGELVERIDKLQADVAAVKTRVERARILGY
jgi:DNA-binding transcriptional ArsR family regulator